MYIIVFQPEKNVRRLTMNSASYKKPVTNTSSVLGANNHDSYTDERIKLNVNYDERHGVRTVPVPVSKTNGDQDKFRRHASLGYNELYQKNCPLPPKV
uniref:Uncharacterized protein n=1 Tax=Magallana gigas TaxID=29159 RepID=K1PYY1_MAGGI